MMTQDIMDMDGHTDTTDVAYLSRMIAEQNADIYFSRRRESLADCFLHTTTSLSSWRLLPEITPAGVPLQWRVAGPDVQKYAVLALRFADELDHAWRGHRHEVV